MASDTLAPEMLKCKDGAWMVHGWCMDGAWMVHG